MLTVVDFFRPGDEVGWQYRRPVVEATLVDERGRATWHHRIMDVSLKDLRRAAAVDLLQGDSLRPYLIPQIPQGDFGTAGEWQNFLSLLKWGWSHLIELGGAYGGVQALRSIRDRLRTEEETVDRHADQWRSRDALPPDIRLLLLTRAWTTAEAARLLGCPEEDASAVLWGMGFVFDEETSTWSPGPDPESRFVASTVLVMLLSGASLEAEEVRTLIAERTFEFAKRGDVEDFDLVAYQRKKLDLPPLHRGPFTYRLRQVLRRVLVRGRKAR
jgi:hypothetical protein